MKPIVTFCLLLALFFSYKANGEVSNVSLSIQIDNILTNQALCDVHVTFNLKNSDSTLYYVFDLPFLNNNNLDYSIVSKSSDQFFLVGFLNTGQGICIINSINKPTKFEAHFTNVEFPIIKLKRKDDGILINLKLYHEYSSQFKNKNSEILKISNFEIQTKSIIDSEPKYSPSEKGSGIYVIKLDENSDNLYFTVPYPQESYFNLFLGLLVIALIIGFISSLKLLKGKTQSYFGLVISIIIGVFLGYLFFAKVIPTDFNRDVDIISLVGGGIGLTIGFFLNSTYNLIVIYTIEKQQSYEKRQTPEEK